MKGDVHTFHMRNVSLICNKELQSYECCNFLIVVYHVCQRHILLPRICLHGPLRLWLRFNVSWYFPFIFRYVSFLKVMAWLTFQDGFVLVGSVAGQRYWSTLLPDVNNITSGVWTPDDQHVYLGTTQVKFFGRPKSFKAMFWWLTCFDIVIMTLRNHHSGWIILNF